MDYPRTVIGFHGCALEVGLRLLKEESFRTKGTKTHHWLGEGSYFWENDPMRAIEWALRKNDKDGKPALEKSFVIGATISLGKCLDLSTQSGIQALKFGIETLETAGHKFINNKKNSDGTLSILRYGDFDLIQSCCRIGKEAKPPIYFDSVRGLFLQGEPLRKGSGILEKSHIQVCVRNPKMILNFFRLHPSMSLDSELLKQLASND